MGGLDIAYSDAGSRWARMSNWMVRMVRTGWRKGVYSYCFDDAGMTKLGVNIEVIEDECEEGAGI